MFRGNKASLDAGTNLHIWVPRGTDKYGPPPKLKVWNNWGSTREFPFLMLPIIFNIYFDNFQ